MRLRRLAASVVELHGGVLPEEVKLEPPQPVETQPPAPETTAPPLPKLSPKALPTWKREVVTLLERHKRYPSDARDRGEQGIVQFRTEFFNILNRPNFANPNATIASFASPAAIQCGPQYAVKSCQFGSSSALAINSTAGQITSTITTSRQIQFSLKLIF